MRKKYSFIASNETINQRLDTVAVLHCRDQGIELTRSGIKARDIGLFVNGKLEKLSYPVKENDKIEFEIPESAPSELKAEFVDFEMVYCDEDIAIVNKPFGLTVHPSKGHESQTLVNGLLYKLKGKLSSIGGIERPGIVHRLDKDTAGLLIIALNDKAHHKLAEDFKARRIKKIYHAIVKGYLEESGKIDAPIGRSPHDRKKMAIITDGKPAITEYKTLEYLNHHTYVEINLLTGRTHQIRVHFSSLGHSVAGDPIYSRNFKQYGLTGIALCAKRLEFLHPISERALQFEIELPKEMLILLEKLRS
jgi:23S rRNA pseudouridine1911/1915/1917 synthase